MVAIFATVRLAIKSSSTVSENILEYKGEGLIYFLLYRAVRQCAEWLRKDMPFELEATNSLEELVFELRTDTMKTILMQVNLYI